jgi:hypothetical protein
MYSLAHAKWSDRGSITFVLSTLWSKEPEIYCISIFFLSDWRAFLLCVCLSVCCILWYETAVRCVQLHSACSRYSLQRFKKKIEIAVYLRENTFRRNTNCGPNALIPNAPRDICEKWMCVCAVSYNTHCVTLHWNRCYIRICNIWMTDVLMSKFIIRGIFVWLQISITYLTLIVLMWRIGWAHNNARK